MSLKYIEKVQEYLLCIMFQLVLPLLPVAFELWLKNSLSEKSLMISVAIYAISIGNTSRNKLLFGFSVFISIIFSVCFGIVLGGGASPPNSVLSAEVSLGFIFLASAIERYTIHITEETKCWAFK